MIIKNPKNWVRSPINNIDENSWNFIVLLSLYNKNVWSVNEICNKE